MEQIFLRSWESLSWSRESPSFMVPPPKIHCSLHKRTPLVPTLSHLNSVHTLINSFF